MSAHGILSRLKSLHPIAIDLSLGRIQRLLSALGSPEHTLPPVIHVAGTNGKGSTIAFLRAFLEAAGRKVHVYTSPHLVRFNERFRLAGTLVDDDLLADTLAEVEQVNAGAPITLFEITTAAGLLMFSRIPADVLLLEVGLGGRLDATNVIETPLASVITPISFDHMEYLGNTLTLIAAEKAGIIKRRVPVIVAPQSDDVLGVIERAAARNLAPLFVCHEHWRILAEHGRLTYEDESGLFDLPMPRLSGRHQIFNAGLAIATLRRAGFDLPSAAYEKGITQAEWPARMQRLSSGRLIEGLPKGAEVWVDGSHNVQGGQILAEMIGDLETKVSRPVIAIVGMLASKDAEGFLAHLSGLVREVIAVDIPGQMNGVPAASLAGLARGVGIPAVTASSLGEALQHCVNTDPAARILITGSLYLAGHVLSENGTELV